jgi:hypothetical protein
VFALLIPVWLALDPPNPDYQQATTDLDSALEGVGGEDVAGTIAALEQGLEQLGQFPTDLRADTAVLAKMGRARIALVALLIERDVLAAATAMDEAIRSARDTELPVRSFGPDVLRLYEQRRSVLEAAGTGTIEVDCQVACEVLINEHLSPNPSDPLYLGAYRVWVRADSGSPEWTYYHVVLDAPDWPETLTYPPPPPLPQVESEIGNGAGTTTDTGHHQGSRTKRMLPRWAEIIGLAAGAGLAVTGGVLLSMNGDCEGGGTPSIPVTCPGVYDNSIQGYTLLGAGIGLFTLAGVMLTVDEVRVGRNNARQAMITWTFRF